jgi:UDP-GlcNAc:undecaprenyl-phosphate GlcNAc-1-phosphate transferase
MPGLGQRRGVVLHARAAPQISEYDNGGSHVMVYLVLGLSSAALALLATPLVSRGSIRLGLVDAPGGRKVHAQSVPRLGGVAVVAATIAAMILVLRFWPADLVPVVWTTLRPFAAAGALIFAIGLLDDVRGVAPAPKLVVQCAAAAVMMASGLLIQRVTLLGVSWELGWLAWPVTTVWIVGLTNAFNLIDGIDGLATGIAVLAGATCAAILIVRGHPAEAMMLAALVGAALGFLVFNFSPASIFLGDSGSLLIGFLLATTAIAGWQKGATALAAGVPLLIFALPLADIATTVVRRGLPRSGGERSSLTAAMRRLVEPDRQHLHHRLLALGWSPRQTVLLLYGVTAVLSLLALATAQTS